VNDKDGEEQSLVSSSTLHRLSKSLPVDVEEIEVLPARGRCAVIPPDLLCLAALDNALAQAESGPLMPAEFVSKLAIAVEGTSIEGTDANYLYERVRMQELDLMVPGTGFTAEDH